MNPMMSEKINELALALSKFQSKVPRIVKAKEVKFLDKFGKQHSYKYADLSDVINTISPKMEEVGLSISQFFEGTRLVTLLLHSSGQWIQSHLNLNCGELKAQERGSEITYMRRYALCSILGIAADEDDDGNAATDAFDKDSESTNAVPFPSKASVAQAKFIRDLYKGNEALLKMTSKFLEARKVEKVDELLAADANLLIQELQKKLKEQTI